MKFKSALVTQASGSIGGATFAHNRGGLYIRGRSIPTDPATVYQQAVRQFMAQLADVWATVLTAAQRSAWDSYSEQVQLTGPLGNDRDVGGIGMFCRCNLPRLQAGLDRVDDGPTTLTIPEFTAPSAISFSEATQEFTVNFDDGDTWVDEDGAAMLVYTSRPKNPGINYFKGPYRFADAIEGDNASPPSSPAAIASPFTISQGQRSFMKISVTRADGRLSGVWRGFCVAAA